MTDSDMRREPSSIEVVVKDRKTLVRVPFNIAVLVILLAVIAIAAVAFLIACRLAQPAAAPPERALPAANKPVESPPPPPKEPTVKAEPPRLLPDVLLQDALVRLRETQAECSRNQIAIAELKVQVNGLQELARSPLRGHEESVPTSEKTANQPPPLPPPPQPRPPPPQLVEVSVKGKLENIAQKESYRQLLNQQEAITLTIGEKLFHLHLGGGGRIEDSISIVLPEGRHQYHLSVEGYSQIWTDSGVPISVTAKCLGQGTITVKPGQKNCFVFRRGAFSINTYPVWLSE